MARSEIFLHPQPPAAQRLGSDARGRSHPCPLLGDDGACLSYRQRPLLCRLHGLPNIDLSGEILQADYCTLNFPDRDALKHAKLRHPFRRLYRREFDLLGEFSELVLDHRDLEIDTSIPLALLIDFSIINTETQ